MADIFSCFNFNQKIYRQKFRKKNAENKPSETGNYNSKEFVHLPEEIIIMITLYLDISSIQCLYETGNEYIRKIIATGVRKCKISLTNVATSEFLKTTFFKDISTNIQELDLSAIYNINLRIFSAAVKNCRKLKTMNVSYTNIRFEDIAGLNIHETCTDLTNVSINFTYNCILPANLSNSRNFVRQLENMHLIVSINNMLFPKLLFKLFENNKLNTLKLTCSRIAMTAAIDEHRLLSQVPVFNQLYVHLLNWRLSNKTFPSLREIPILAMLDLNKYEFIIIYSPSLTIEPIVLVSSVFVWFFSKFFDLDVCCISALYDVFDLDSDIRGNAAIMIWKKDVNNFDDMFFRNLYREIRQYFSYCPKSHDSIVPNRYNWFVFTPTIPENNEVMENKTKQSFVLDYDTLFENKQDIQISFELHNLVGIPVSLSDTSEYLSKITYLSLYGLVKYTPTFFHILFECCTNLITLNVEAAFESSCWLPLCQSLKLSSSLKNFRLVDRKINYETFLLEFCYCKSIEKIYIKEDIDVRQHTNIKFSNILLLLFLNCPNLYSLNIDTRKIYIRYAPTFIEIVSNGSVGIKRQPTTEEIVEPSIYSYDPDIDVFKLNPIGQI